MSRQTEQPIIWLTKTSLPTRQAEQLLACLSASEAARLAEFQAPAKRSEYVASRWLLRKALSARFGASFQHWQIHDQAGAAPVVENGPEPCFVSLSHSGAWVAIALDKQPLGLDIERTRPMPLQDKIAQRLFTAKQCQQLDQSPKPQQQQLFFQYWTAKEALYKAHSQLGQPQAFFRRSLPATTPFHVSHHDQSNYAIALAQHQPDTIWRTQTLVAAPT